MATIGETINAWIKQYDETEDWHQYIMETILICSEEVNRGCREHLDKIKQGTKNAEKNE